jgi:NTE family protein
VKKINLALQGGGAHGAFTWGVLETLLADPEIEIAAISGTSAGALNAAALKAGIIAGGRAGAIANLEWLWHEVGAVTDPRASDWLTALAPASAMIAKALEYSPVFSAMDITAEFLSPYALGPFMQNPLRRIVEKFAYDAVCHSDGPELHICATNVRSGKIRVFTGSHISTESIMASACLPTFFQAVEMTDPVTGQTEAYWDGGYAGNPALFPLYAKHLPDDILIVQINPLYRAELPKDSQAIQNRVNEISFNASLLADLRAVKFVKDLIAEGAIPKGSKKDVLVHMIADDALMNELSVATKMVPVPVILARLRAAGQAAAGVFLGQHRGDLNERSSVKLDELLN